MRKCDHIAAELSDALDGEVPVWKLVRIRMHLAVCRPCRRLRESLDRTVGTLQALRDRPPADT